jgi:anti-sigma factor RsiW
MSRSCDEVCAELPSYVRGELPRLRRRLVGQHLRRCADCQAEHSRQRDLAAGLDLLAAPASASDAPPEGLLEDLLADAASTGVKGRVAGSARGAVSGARPALSLALLVGAAAAGTGAGWGALRAGRAVRGALRRR